MTTPGGSPAATSASRRFTASMVARAFSPKRMTTMPPTASPRPSRSAMPRRAAGPTVTRPSSATRTGTPLAVAPTTTSSMSAMDLRYPRPRTMCSRSESSTTMAPTSELAFWRAAITRVIGMPYACSRAGSRSTWYCFSNPPSEATSATPGTAVRA
jgi:hypothetical protein